MSARGPSVDLLIEVRMQDRRLLAALAEALSADSRDPRFPFELDVGEGALRLRPARPMDAGDAEAFINSALSLLKAAYSTLVLVKRS